ESLPISTPTIPLATIVLSSPAISASAAYLNYNYPRPNNDRYPVQMMSPNRIPTQAPPNIHGPNGIPLFLPTRRRTSRMIENTPPSTNAANAPTTSWPQPSQARNKPRTPA